MIGTGDGQQFESEMDHALSQVADKFGRPTGGPYPMWEHEFGHSVNRPEELLDHTQKIPGLDWYDDSPTNAQQLRNLNQRESNFNVEMNSKGAIHPDSLGIQNDRRMDINPDRGGQLIREFQPGSIEQKVLSHPEISDNLNNLKVDREHDVPYEAGPSKEGSTLYLDKSIPKEVHVSGISFDPATPAAIHEFTERHVMNQLIKKGMTNEKAYEIAHHEYAEPAEDAWYRSHGIDVDEVNKLWAKWDKGTEQEKATDKDFPKDLYTKPYAHNKVEGIKHEPSGVSDEWAVGTKIAMNEEHEGGRQNLEDPHADRDVGHITGPLPGVPLASGNASARGMPSRSKAIKETLTPDINNRAALKSTKGEVFTGMNHGDALEKLEAAGHNIDFKSAAETIDAQGFITSTGRFIGRDEAAKLAIRAGQADRRAGKYLTSEDLDPYTYEKWQMMKQGMDPNSFTSPRSLQGWSDPDKPLIAK